MLIYKWHVQNNTLVNDDGRAMLTDFGLAKVIEELAGPTGNTTSMCAGCVRWQAPELIWDTISDQGEDTGDAPKPSSPTRASDIWSFGCTAYEVRLVRSSLHSPMIPELCSFFPLDHDGQSPLLQPLTRLDRHEGDCGEAVPRPSGRPGGA